MPPLINSLCKIRLGEHERERGRMHSLIVREKFPPREKRVTARTRTFSIGAATWISDIGAAFPTKSSFGLRGAPWHVS